MSDLDELLKKAKAAFEALSPEQQRTMRRQQAISFVYGNLMDSPGITREMVEKAYDER